MRSSESAVLAHAERAAAIAISTVLVLAHVEVRRHAGPLWRDEAATVNVATMPSLGELWSGLEFDSFPALVALTLRSVVAVFGPGDAVLRNFGLAIGLAVIAAVWWNVRATARALPIVSLALLAGSDVVIRYGDSMRGYGIGSVLILITLGLLWRVVEEPSARSIVPAALFSILSVQALYYNSVLLLAACCGGAAVGLRRRSWKLPAVLLAIGLSAALSMLPYLPIMARTRGWNILLQQSIDVARIGRGFAEAAGGPGAVVWVWVALLALALTAGGYLVFARAGAVAEQDRERGLFLATAGLVGAAAYAGFLRALGYEPRSWYFVPVLAFLAAVAEGLLELFIRTRNRLRVLRLTAAVLLTALAVLAAWPHLRVRQSRLDRIAAKVQELAAQDDLVVVDPWENGISFMRYYRGTAPWLTVPPISDHRTHRYDLLKDAMLHPDSIEPVLARVEQTLTAGHRVWVVQWSEFAAPDTPPERLPPPPLEIHGWHAGPYVVSWSQQFSFLLGRHARTWGIPPVPPEEPVSRFEDLRLLVFEGWRG